jgi:hypothetical protein
MKAMLIRFGVRNFNPVLRKAREKLDAVRTPEGLAQPPNTACALRRNMERLHLIKSKSRSSSRHNWKV